MKLLYKHKLDFDRTLEYVKDNWDDVTTLSREILNLLDFKTGYFFTLLPSDANLKAIYDFKLGGILPQFPEQEHIVNGYRSTFSWIPTIDTEISHLIFRRN